MTRNFGVPAASGAEPVTLTGDQDIEGVKNFLDGVTVDSVAVVLTDDARLSSGAQKSANLSDLANAATARTNLSLGNVSNTSDATKNTAIATLTNKTLTSPVVNSPTGIVKADVGLGNVDNTSNATERAATATLTNKTLTSPAITTPTGIVKGDVGLGNVDNTSNATERAAVATLTNKTLTSPAITTPTGIVKGDVGLGSVDNTADTAKPVSTAQQTALDLKLAKASNLSDLANAGTSRTNLGLGTSAVLAAGGASGAATLDSGSKLTRSQLPIAGTLRNDLETAVYMVIPTFGATQSGAMTANRAYALPFVLSANVTLGDFGIDCTAVATGGSVRAGLYAVSSGRPGSLITDYGQQTAPTGGVAMMWWTTTDVLTAGVEYFAVVVAQGLTGSPTFRQRNTNTAEVNFGSARPTSLSGSLCSYYSDTGFSGALPGSFGTVAGIIAGPCVVLKV